MLVLQQHQDMSSSEVQAQVLLIQIIDTTLSHSLPTSATHSLAALCGFLELLCKHLFVFGKASKICMFANLISIILLADQIHKTGLLHEHKLTVVISTQIEVIITITIITITIAIITIINTTDNK